MENSSSIKDLIRYHKPQEKYFRDFFGQILEEREKSTDIEKIGKSDRPTDITVYLKNLNNNISNKVIIELKIWKHNFALILIFNPNKSKIKSQYKNRNRKSSIINISITRYKNIII